VAVGRECGGDGTSLTRRETDLVAHVDGVGGGRPWPCLWARDRCPRLPGDDDDLGLTRFDAHVC